MAVNCTTMWWLVVCQVSCLLLVAGMPVIHNSHVGISNMVNCVDYSSERFAQIMNEGWRSHTPLNRKVITKRSLPDVPAHFVHNRQAMSRRMDTIKIIDNLIPRGDYLIKEHAKLVHDINSLRQVVFVRPLADDNKDYDDSIFHEVIETVATPTLRPPFSSSLGSTIKPYSTSTAASSIPVILIGGASQRQVVKSQTINFAKPTISLIGTTASPVVKHPYPFVIHRKPVKICVTSVPTMRIPQPPRKSLWERLLDYFIPRRNFR